MFVKKRKEKLAFGYIIMDLKENNKSLIEDDSNKKCCTDCKTTRTPLWRGGPAGPKSLCNACGIRYRKKRRAMMGLNKGIEKGKQSSSSNTTAAARRATSSTNSTISASVSTKSTGNALISESLKMRLMVLGEEMMLQRSSIVKKKQRCQRRRKWGEEEQAAFSLMALSCGSVFA